MRVLTLVTVLLFGCQTSPGVKKDSGVLLSLQRTACYGACPVYVVEVFSDGTLHFKGERHVKVTEPIELKLAPGVLEKLIARVDQSGFAGWNDFTTNSVSDAPTVVLSYKGRAVRHYRGDDQAPPELTALEDEVDALLGTDRWVKGAGGETQ
ncbi:MAG: DUF6438 domain-containing protein [Archangium sp.]|nr:DUF6438 domain-containing protein [Archangium sp.]